MNVNQLGGRLGLFGEVDRVRSAFSGVSLNLSGDKERTNQTYLYRDIEHLIEAVYRK